MLRRALIRACCALCLAGDVAAQERMEILVSDGATANQAMLELDVSAAGFGGVGRVSPVPFLSEVIYSTPAAVVGGRYLTWINGGRSGSDRRFLQVFDRQTRSYVVAGETGATSLLPDPKRPRVFSKVPLLNGATPPGDVYVFDIPSRTSRGISLGGGTGFGARTVGAFTYAADADQVIGLRTTFTPAGTVNEVVAADVATGAIVRQFAVPNEPLSLTATDRDARRVYLSGISFFPGPVVSLDLATGLAVARSSTQVTAFVLDEERGRGLATTRSPPALVVLDAITLVERTTIPLAGPAASVAVWAGRGRTGAYVTQAAWRSTAGCTFSITAFDDALVPRGSVGVDADTGLRPIYCSAGLVTVVAPPEAPAPFAGTVTGRRVDLSWRDRGDTTSFEMEVGLAPGTTVLRLPMGLATSTALDDAPPGTYYVRVVAVNDVGRSLPSNEVRVDVP